MASRSVPPNDEDAGKLYLRATTAEHWQDYDAAFRLYLAAAQAYLHRARTLPVDQQEERKKCKEDAGKCLERAERIKAARKDTLKPQVRSPFSKGT